MMMTTSGLDTDRVVHDPAILVGKPVVRGTRISVELVLGQLAVDLDLDELFAMYPRLSRADVQAVLTFAEAAVARDRAKQGSGTRGSSVAE